MGTPAFAVPSLQKLIESGMQIDLVITQPDKPVGRKQEITPPPVKILAQKHTIPVFQPKNINKEWEEYVSKQSITAPDFLIVVAYGQILSDKLLSWPNVAPINVHGSLLPQFRGASPIQEAILQNENETGVTIQRMVKELDAGPILSQEKITIDARETFTTLHDKLSFLGAALLPNTLSHPITENPQDEAKKTMCRKLTRADGTVDITSMTAEEIDRKVRALNPWPGVTMDTLKLLETSLIETNESTPIQCKNSVLHLVRVQPAGKKPMSGKEWERGKR